MSDTQSRIKELALIGFSHQEVARELPHLQPSTVRVYFNRILQGLAPEQRERVEQARAKRNAPATTTAYHRPFAEREALSPEHIRIGRKLLASRLEEEMTLAEFSSHHDFSNRVTLSAMEQGYHDFTITEVRKIARMLGTSVEDLICPSSSPGAIAA